MVLKITQKPTHLGFQQVKRPLMSTSIITGDGELPANHLNVAEKQRENIRQTLENIQSQSNSILLLALQWKDLEEYFDSIFTSITKREEEIELKTKQIEWKLKYINKKASDTELKEEELEERLNMVDEMCREVNERCKEVRGTEKYFDDEVESLRWKFESLRKYKRSLKRQFGKKELKLEARELWVDSREHEVELRRKKLSLIERKLLERLEEIKERERKLELKDKKVKGDYNDVKVCYGDDEEEGDDYADLRFNVVMNGRDLQMFLNGRVNDHEQLRDEVTRGIGLSADPAKLVLDAIEGFYPRVLEYGDVGFELDVVRKSCVLLLEQLIEVKPRIRDHVRERAMRVALEWKRRMNVDETGCHLEVVGFLQLVATYGLRSEFNKNELLSLFESCARHDRAPELCRSLGFTDDVHDIIQNLIFREQPFEAIRLVYAFGLVDIIPPVPILRAHLKSTYNYAEEVYQDEGPSVEVQIKCINMKLAALVSVVRCIKEHGLDSKYSVQPLEQLVSELKRQRRKCNASASVTKAKVKTENEELCITLSPISSSAKETASFSVSPELVPRSPIRTGKYAQFTMGLESSCSPTVVDKAPVSDSDLNPCLNASHMLTYASVNCEDTSHSGITPETKRPRLASVVVTHDSELAPTYPQWASYTPGPVYYHLTDPPANGSYGNYVLSPYCT